MDGPAAGSAGRWLAFERLAMAVRPVVDVLARAAPRLAVAVVALQLAAGLVTAGVVLASAAAINALLAHALNAERLRAAVPALLFLAGAFVVKLALDALTARVRAELSPRVHRIAQARLLEASLQVELAAFDDPGFYDQLHRARDRGVLHMESATDSLVDALSALVGVAGAALALIWLDPVLLPVLALALLPQAWGALAVARLHIASMPETVSLNRQVDMMIELATDRDNAPEIRSYQAQEYVSAEYARSADAMQAHLVRLGVAEARVRTLGNVLSALGMALTFAVLGGLLWTERLPLAAAGATLFAVRSAGQALERLMQVGSSLFEKGLYLADYRAFLEQAAQRQRPATGIEAPTTPALIELERVGFHYAGRRDDPALRDISLSIRAGETIALVGENGSGKTTLAKLIAGLYRPAEGHIRWDGTDLRDIDPRSLADRIAMVLQHPVRWPRSAASNVRVGRHARVDPGDAALKHAAGESRAQEVIDRLPQGWDTLLSRTFRGGVDLSGGQWQRLAVARGLYRDAPLVIWDEPTAPLDARAEHAVFESLRQLARNRTVILITHRLASVRNADRIFFLERGRLVEQGRHDDLLAADGRYAELYRLQTRLHALEEAATAQA
jgi:ABC-type multidrug transport system fused ATPase/permease subunit